jgi:hypothetical protein
MFFVLTGRSSILSSDFNPPINASNKKCTLGLTNFEVYNSIPNIQDEVARWPHGCRRQCSEVAVPALVGSNPTEGGGFFRRKETPPGHGCVCMSSRG